MKKLIYLLLLLPLFLCKEVKLKYNVYLLNYNNYYNRQVKKLNTIQDYINGGYQLNTTVENINVAFGDGLTSELIINQSFVNKQPDYVIIEERDHASGEEGNFSRWFIIDSELTRGGQYHFSIKRDICADFYDLMMNSTYFVERGYVSNSNDLIFNNENSSYSQIKQYQTPLYDETGVPWIVGYMARNAAGGTSSKKISTTAYTGQYWDHCPTGGLSNWEFWDYCRLNPNYISLYGDDPENAYRFLVKIPVETTDGWNNKTYDQIYLNFSASQKMATNIDIPTRIYSDISIPSTGYGTRSITQSLYESYKSDYGWYNLTTVGYRTYLTPLYNSLINSTINNMNNNALAYSQMISAFRSLYNPDNQIVREVEGLNGQTIKDETTGKIYRIALDDRVVNLTPSETTITNNSPNLRTRIKFLLDLNESGNWGITNNYHTDPAGTYPEWQIEIDLYIRSIQINLVEIGNVATWLPGDDNGSTISRQHTADASFDMFAIPYGELQVKYGNDTITCNKELALSMACAFSEGLGSKLYDLQIVPYCPVRQYIKDNGDNYIFDITGEDLSANSGVKRVKKIVFSPGDTETTNDIAVGFVFYCDGSVQNRIPLQNKNKEAYNIEITDYKKSYNLDMYRLSSPNFAASFEFSPAQNGGVSRFMTSFTYKPYTPYIRVWPEWGRMFGTADNNQDGRGLILQGDFSVPAMLNKWEEYEIQNKNYLNSFNREIASMKTQFNVDKEKELWQSVGGVFNGTAQGGFAGAKVGGVYGAIAGAAVGAGTSIFGASRDIKLNNKLRNDALDKAKTLFDYSIDNIKALPNTIRNIGCLTNDNLLVPVIEYYTASSDEIEAFEYKMQYYGMSVKKVGRLIEYVNPLGETFIQATLLRLLPPEGVIEESDNHFAEELSDEIQKGIYIGG